MTALPLVAALLAGQSATAPVPAETHCDYMVGTEARTTPELHILRQTQGDGPFAPGLPAGAAIRCGRADMVPAANDWKVLAAGYPLVIIEATGADARVAVLEAPGGHVRYRFLTGRLTEAEAPGVEARLNAFQAHLER